MSSSGDNKATDDGLSMPEPRHIPSERPGPAGGKRDANRRAKTEALCRAGLDLFLERGVEAVTIDDLARGAGVAKGSFYRYFKDKQDLVDALFEPLYADMADAFGKCRESLRKASQANLAMAYIGLARDLTRIQMERGDFIRLYLQENRAPGVGAREPIAKLAELIESSAIEMTHIAHDAGLLISANPTVTALAVVGATERLAYAHLGGKFEGQNEAGIAATLIGMILEGMLPKTRAKSGTDA